MVNKKIKWHGNLNGGENVIAFFVKEFQKWSFQEKMVSDEKAKTNDNKEYRFIF